MSTKNVSWAERLVNGLEERPLFFRGVGSAKTKPAEKKKTILEEEPQGKNLIKCFLLSWSCDGL